MILLDIVVFVLVLGLVIFFHELGHFVAAKACGIYCERFSLGMPPRLFGVRLGETDYCVGALPLGGYVKMAGQEDTPKSEEEQEQEYGHVPRERWFSSQPVWQRFIVVGAGPSMNLVLGILLYMFVALAGAEVPESRLDNRIGYVEPGTPAATAPLYRLGNGPARTDTDREADAVGWQTGDRIISIDGHTATSVAFGVRMEAALGAQRTLSVVIERHEKDETTRYLSPIEPRQLEDEDLARFGIHAWQTALVDRTLPGSPAEEAGLREGDVIVRANGEVIEAQTFSRLVEETPQGESIRLTVQRDGDLVEMTLSPATVGRFRGVFFNPPLVTADPGEAQRQPVVAGVTAEVREDIGLRRRDTIVAVEGQPATVERLRALETHSDVDEVQVTVERPEVLFGCAQKEETLQFVLPIEPVRQIGVVWGEKTVFYRPPTRRVVPEAFSQAYDSLRWTYSTVRMLVTRRLSPRELGGPVMIYRVAAAARRQGLSLLLETTAFLSINLFVLNLLPLPVLDGGLLVFLGLEGIRRKPLSVKVLERIQQVGLALILMLFLFVTINDIYRWITSVIP